MTLLSFFIFAPYSHLLALCVRSKIMHLSCYYADLRALGLHLWKLSRLHEHHSRYSGMVRVLRMAGGSIHLVPHCRFIHLHGACALPTASLPFLA